MKRRIMLAILSLLGFASACKEEEGQSQELPTMYGTPRVDYRVRGKVTDAQGRPVPGIAVTNRYDETKAQSDADGRYDLSGNMTPHETELIFTDIDGPDNGGEFTEKTLPIRFTESDRTGPGDGWYAGSFARSDQDVTLERKESEAEQ